MADLHSTRPWRGGLLLPLALVRSTIVTACGSGSDHSGFSSPVSGYSSRESAFHGARLDRPYAVDPARLRATSRGRLTLVRPPRGTVSVVFSGYTHCEDVRRIVMGTIASAYAQLDPAQQRRVQVLFVTTDPRRDNLSALRRYLARYNPKFVGLTGDMATLRRVAASMKIYSSKGHRLNSGGYEVDHTAEIEGIAGIGQQVDEVSTVWDPTISPSELAEDLRRLAG